MPKAIRNAGVLEAQSDGRLLGFERETQPANLTLAKNVCCSYVLLIHDVTFPDSAAGCSLMFACYIFLFLQQSVQYSEVFVGGVAQLV